MPKKSKNPTFLLFIAKYNTVGRKAMTKVEQKKYRHRKYLQR